MVAHAFDQHSGGRGRQISEFKAHLVYKVSSRTARAIQRNPVFKTKQNKTNMLVDSELGCSVGTGTGPTRLHP